MWYIILGASVVFIPTMSYLIMKGAWDFRKNELLELRNEIIEMKTKDENLNEYLDEINKLLREDFKDFAFRK